MYTRFEGDHSDLLLAANGVGELFLHMVVGLLLRRVGDLRELGIAAATGEDAPLGAPGRFPPLDDLLALTVRASNRDTCYGPLS